MINFNAFKWKIPKVNCQWKVCTNKCNAMSTHLLNDDSKYHSFAPHAAIAPLNDEACIIILTNAPTKIITKNSTNSNFLPFVENLKHEKLEN